MFSVTSQNKWELCLMDHLTETKQGDKMFLCVHTTSNSQLWDVYGQSVKCKHSSLPPPTPSSPHTKHASPCAQSLQPIIDTHLNSEISQVGTIKTSTTHIQHFEWTWATFYGLQIFYKGYYKEPTSLQTDSSLRLWSALVWSRTIT